MKNKQIANVLIIIFILYLIVDYIGLQVSGGFWILFVSLFLIISIWSIVKLFKLKFPGIATFGIISLIVSYIIAPHIFLDPIHIIGLLLLIIYVVIASNKLYKEFPVSQS